MLRFASVAMAVGLTLVGTCGASVVCAQELRSAEQRVWDIGLGLQVSELPSSFFVEPACGSNGGPPGLLIADFSRFEMCPLDPTTGLREISFVHDDMMEYVARARRDPVMIQRFHANYYYSQMMVSSILVGETGLIMGYRFITDSRTDSSVRVEAHNLGYIFQSRFGIEDWNCTDLAPAEGETPVGGEFVKTICTKLQDGRQYVVERRLYYKPGQSMLDPFNRRLTENEFESSARLEVLQVDPLTATQLAREESAALAFNVPGLASQRDKFLAGDALICRFCDLSRVDLRRRELVGADLTGANLEEAILHRANLREATLVGANLTNANLNKADLKLADLQNSNLYGAMLFEADASHANFSGANFRFALMGRIRLILANLSDAVFDSTDMEAAQANDTNFSGATMFNVNFHKAILIRANLSQVDAREIYAEDTEFRKANLRFAKFVGSNLLRADLSEADLTATDFTDAWLLSASLQNAIIDGTIFTGATMPDNTIAP